jgi:uncharacterized membrane protein
MRRPVQHLAVLVATIVLAIAISMALPIDYDANDVILIALLGYLLYFAASLWLDSRQPK